VHVKICGITRPEDAELAVALGAWAIGLIFHEPSPRVVDVTTAAEIGAEYKRMAEVAGVFVNRPLDEVAELADVCSLSIVQLHGDEGPVYADELRRRTGLKIMKSARVRDAASLQALKRLPPRRLPPGRRPPSRPVRRHGGDRSTGSSCAAAAPRFPWSCREA